MSLDSFVGGNEYAEMLKLFNQTYPKDSSMPFQGAWPIDLWALEATMSEHPELWWRYELACECGEEVCASYKGRYYCKTHLDEALK